MTEIKKESADGAWLRSTLAELAGDAFPVYDLPSLRNARKVVVDAAVVTGETRPYIIYESDEAGSLRAVTEERRAAGSGGSG